MSALGWSEKLSVEKSWDRGLKQECERTFQRSAMPIVAVRDDGELTRGGIRGCHSHRVILEQYLLQYVLAFTVNNAFTIVAHLAVVPPADLISTQLAMKGSEW